MLKLLLRILIFLSVFLVRLRLVVIWLIWGKFGGRLRDFLMNRLVVIRVNRRVR